MNRRGAPVRPSDPARRAWLRDRVSQAVGACGVLGPLASVGRPAVAADPDRRVAWPMIELLGGGRVVPADWDDTAAVLVIWATWCGFCTRHNAHVERLHRQTAGRRLRVLGACLDGDDPDRVRAHLARHGWTFPVTLQGERLRALFTTRRVVPMTVGVDRRGRVHTPIPGEMAEADVMALAALAADR